MKKLICILFIVIGCMIFTSCKSTTDVYFDSEPLGASIYIDGEYKGKTPQYIKMSNSVFEEKKVILKKDGYKTRTFRVEKEGKTFNIISGILLWMPSLFYCYGPEEYQHATMIRIPTEQ